MQATLVFALGALVAALALSAGMFGGAPAEGQVVGEVPIVEGAAGTEVGFTDDVSSLYVSADPFQAFEAGRAAVGAPRRESVVPPAVHGPSGIHMLPTHFFSATRCETVDVIGNDGLSYTIEACGTCYYLGIFNLLTLSITCETTVGIVF